MDPPDRKTQESEETNTPGIVWLLMHPKNTNLPEKTQI